MAAPVKRSVREVNQEDLEALEQFANDWASLEEMRRKTRRSVMYAWGDQWGDLVRDPDTGQMITEGDLIKKQGKVPLKNNMIAPILSNIEGQLRTAQTKPVCVVRDQRETKLGEMMSMAVEYVHDINEVGELDVATLKSEATSGVMAQRIEYGINPDKGNKQDVWVYPVETARLFFDGSVEDPRMWGLARVGELYDMTIEDVVANFGKFVPEQELRDIYGGGGTYLDSRALNGEKLDSLNFYTPSQPNMCRVILGWRLENRPAIYWQDFEKGTYGYAKRSEKHLIDEENERRMQYYTLQGVAEEDVPLIEYTDETERVWIYRYMTPWGHCLVKGDSPYWHGEHNFVLGVYHLTGGKLYNYVEQFIDQQRSINRTATLIDFIRGASSKGVMIVDETAFESMTREEIVDEYVRWNGVLFVKPKQGVNVRDVVHQLNGAASTAGDYELLNLQLRLINEISGVNSAMQGHAPHSGTPSSLYAQQVQNSSLNLKGLFGALTAFRRRRDTKVMKTIQQFYNQPMYLDIAGVDYSEEAKWYNPEKVKNADIDLTVTEGNNSPAFQVLQNDFLMQLFNAKAIDVSTMLENTSYPFATRLLEAVKRKEADAQQIQQAMLEAQQNGANAVGAQPMSAQMQRAMSGTPGAQDGLIQKVA